MLGASGAQIPQDDLDNLRSTEDKEDRANEVLDPQDVSGSVLLEIIDFAILVLLLEALVFGTLVTAAFIQLVLSVQRVTTVYESEVKRISSSTNTQNTAFVSSSLNNFNRSNGVNIAQGVNIANEVNTVSSQVNAASLLNIDNLSDAVIYAFLASQPNSTHLFNEDLEQIHLDNLEKIDLKWKMAMLTMRAMRFLKNTGRKLNLNENDSVSFDKTKVECYNCHKRGHFAREFPPPHTGLFTPPKSDLSYTGLEELFNKPNTKKSKDKSNDVEPKSVRKGSDTPIIEDWVLDDIEEKVEKKEVKPSINQINFVKATTDNNPKETVTNGEKPKQNTIRKRGNHRNWNGMMSYSQRVNHKNHSKAKWNYVPQVALTVNAARPINVVQPKRTMNVVNQESYFSKQLMMKFMGDMLPLEEILKERRLQAKPVVAESNDFLGTKVSNGVEKEKQPERDYILLPLWTTDSPFSTTSKSSQDNEFQHLNEGAKNSSGVNAVGTNISIDLSPAPNMPLLEDIGIFEDSHDDEDVFGAEADFHNLDSTFQVSPISTIRIHKDHPLKQVEWKQYATMMRQNKNLMDINIDALYNILKQNQGDVNGAMGSKTKTVVITSDLLALIAEKTNVSKKSNAITARRKDIFAKDCKKAKVKDYEYYKTKMVLVKKDKDEQVLLVEDQAWMESSSDSDQEINANMVFMAQIEKVISDSVASLSSADEKIFEVSYYLLESESESEFETSKYYDNSTNYGLFVDNDDD
nr:hypothetical protein [Tanacetum cinerariifolium]